MSFYMTRRHSLSLNPVGHELLAEILILYTNENLSHAKDRIWIMIMILHALLTSI